MSKNGKNNDKNNANANGKINGNGNGKAEIDKMKANPMSKSKSAGGAKSSNSQNNKNNSNSSAKNAKNATSTNATNGSNKTENAEDIDKGGKFDAKKALLNKFKFKMQKDSVEEAKAEAEANRCDPCNEFKSSNGLDCGCVDWGKCAFAKPCCKKFPMPCSCFAYMCVGVTFFGGLISSILLF